MPRTRRKIDKSSIEDLYCIHCGASETADSFCPLNIESGHTFAPREIIIDGEAFDPDDSVDAATPIRIQR